MSPYSKIVILTGAGISKESGIDTFRDNGGVWEHYKIEDVCTPEALKKNREQVLEFYNQRRSELISGLIQPNPAHQAIAELQSKFHGELLLVTQNIDNLHEAAGSRKVHHMHGELLKAECSSCSKNMEWLEAIKTTSQCPKCREQTLRPHVVFFGEMPIGIERIYESLESADLFLSIGTSGNVYPAAGFVEIAKQNGAKSVELNLEASANADVFDDGIYGPASSVVPEYCRSLLA